MPGRNDAGPLIMLLLLVIAGLVVICGCIALTGAPPGMSGERM